MKILFVIKNTANLRTLASVVRLLDERGHDISLACRDVKSTESRAMLDSLVSGSSAITLVPHPFGRVAGWSDLAASLRRTIDYLRYLEPAYDDCPKLRARAADEAPPHGRRFSRRAASIPGGAALARKALQAVERRLEPPPAVLSFLEEHDPDVVLVTPLIGFGTPQADVVRGAKRLGIPVCFPVRSWDNLTNKGLVRDPPDLVLVWNDLQKAEAIELHKIPADRVVVTGAPAYDHWFDWRPSRTREQFLGEVGLDPAKPAILYVGSSEFIAPDEPRFVTQWAAALRARGGVLGDAGLLVRPHPLAAAGFRDLQLDDPQIAVWPRNGEFPLGDTARDNFFDSIHHSAAVVGINTSAQIESAIVGRPVLTILADEFKDTQEGTLHFRYLADSGYGHLRTAGTHAEHAEQLERALAGGEEDLNERFLLRFVRPFGLDLAATPRAADAIEELAARGRRPPQRPPVLAGAMRAALQPLAARKVRIHREEKGEAVRPPLDELKRTVRKAVRSGKVVVAGPWEGDETGELLYWIPFLRWVSRTAFDLTERFVVLARRESMPWYTDLPGRLLAAGDGDLSDRVGADDVVRLAPSLVEENRAALAGHDPLGTLPARRLEFEPPKREDGASRPVAVRVDPGAPVALAGMIAGLGDVERLEGRDRQEELDVLQRARVFVGSYGPTAVAAVLAGIPAIAVAAPGELSEHDLRLVASLPRPPFGRLHIVAPEDIASVPQLVAELGPVGRPLPATV